MQSNSNPTSSAATLPAVNDRRLFSHCSPSEKELLSTIPAPSAPFMEKEPNPIQMLTATSANFFQALKPVHFPSPIPMPIVEEKDTMQMSLDKLPPVPTHTIFLRQNNAVRKNELPPTSTDYYPSCPSVFSATTYRKTPAIPK